MVKQLDYTYDLFTNLRSQKKTFYLRSSSGQITCNGTQAATANATETYAYDDLQRLTGASRVWTGMAWQAPTTPSDSYDYDDLGNFKSKSDYADKYTYNITRSDLTPLPHAVGAVSLGGVTKATFSYDPNGNLTDGDGRHIDFDDFDRPVKITMGSVTTFFRYAPDGSRYLQQTTTSSSSTAVTKTVYYVGKYYERVDWSDGKTTEEHTYIGPSIAVYQSGSKRDVRYMHLDRLGSVEAVTNALGAEVTGDAHSFDAFGKPRARDWQVQDKLHPNGDFGATTEHGFTGHEHLDDTYLIHMNGRVYDYRLGRFLTVDPVISGTDSQALNPYSYVGNNPFSGKDPTGYYTETSAELGSHVRRETKESVAAKIDAGMKSGTINAKTSVDEASKTLKTDIKSAFYGTGLKFSASGANGAQPQGTKSQSGPTSNAQGPGQVAAQDPATNAGLHADIAAWAHQEAVGAHQQHSGEHGPMYAKWDMNTVTPELSDALEQAEDNPEIGDRIRALRLDPKATIRFEQWSPLVLPPGGAHSGTDFNMADGTSVSHVQFNLERAQAGMQKYFGVGISLVQIITHELGHIEEQLTEFRDPNADHNTYQVRSNATGLYFENVMRGSGPFRKSHDVEFKPR
jgi:RHS repeat-associated protein